MEQEDFVLREIEKIGAILSAIRQIFFGGKDNLAIIPEKQLDNAKDVLLNQIDFDLDEFLELNTEDSIEYMNSLKGFNVENLELLADCIAQTGFIDKGDSQKKYFEKALQLYELCNLKSKTYSIERESKIKAILFV